MHFFYFFVLISFYSLGKIILKITKSTKFVDDGELVGIQTCVIKDGKTIHYKNMVIQI